MTEVENIVNCRPLTTQNLSDPSSLEPLTPNHLLTMKSKVLLPPPGRFTRSDLYARKRWRRVQYMANIFWNRWRQEVVHNLQIRKKWIFPKRNMKPGDIVILRDEDNVTRNNWKLARVENVIPSEGGSIRKVKLRMADDSLDQHGRRTRAVNFLDRPVSKLVLLIAIEEGCDQDSKKAKE